jgi:hypothetical protein
VAFGVLRKYLVGVNTTFYRVILVDIVLKFGLFGVIKLLLVNLLCTKIKLGLPLIWQPVIRRVIFMFGYDLFQVSFLNFLILEETL